MQILTEELVYDKNTRQIAKDHGQQKALECIRQAPVDDLADFNATRALGPGIENGGGQVNFGSYREGVLGAHDYRNIKLLSMNADKFFGPNAEAAAAELRVL